MPIHPDCFALTGLSWKFIDDSEDTYLYDCRLPFGGSRSCRIFQALSSAVVRIMTKAGYSCIAYIDDYMVIGSCDITWPNYFLKTRRVFLPVLCQYFAAFYIN